MSFFTTPSSWDFTSVGFLDWMDSVDILPDEFEFLCGQVVTDVVFAAESRDWDDTVT